jgi:replicative DNA helicase
MSKAINYHLNDYDLKPLPHDVKLERMILGIFLDVPQLVEQMSRYLTIEGLFYEGINNKVFEAINKIVSLKMVASSINVEGYFTRLGDKDTAIHVKVLQSNAGDISAIRQYCLRLFELAILRNIIRLGFDINQRGLIRNDALELLGSASNGIGKLYQHIASMKTKTLADGVDELAEELVEIANSPDGMLGIKGTIQSLNNIFKGYRKGNMIVIAASSGEGKSTFMLQEASYIASQDIPVGIISLEMTQSELLLKICCEKLNLDIDLALSGKLTGEDMSRLSAMLGTIKKMPFHISETAGMKIGEIKATARMWKNRNKIKILFIDHMHLANSDWQKN